MSESRFLIDLTTSRAYKGINPVGIVRTEREIGKALLATGHDIEFFYFEPESKKFLLIPRVEATAILGEARILESGMREVSPVSSVRDVASEVGKGDDHLRFLKQVQSRLTRQITSRQLSRTHGTLQDEVLEFFDGDVVISAGLLWDGDYLELLYNKKKSTDLFLAQIIYDIVPILIPEFCVPGMNIRFPKFLLDASWTADAFYCISDSTLRDVEAYLRKNNLPIPALHRIELGADSEQYDRTEFKLSSTVKPGSFITYVSTIEPRKNHMTLFHVWRQLYQTNREALIPLVIVGRQGWNSSDLITMIKAAEHLYPKYIKFMTDVSDSELDWLYRNSRFTVYPSLYEGWGLPVAESLARGKFCIAASTSSIPEVAQGCAELIDPLDSLAWTNSIRHFLTNPEDIFEREKEIKDKYKPTSWASAMEEFVTSIVQTVDLAHLPAHHDVRR